MHGIVEYPRCHGTVHPHPMQESNPRVASDFDPRAPSDGHFDPPRDVALFHESTDSSSLFPSLARDTQVATLPSFDSELTKGDVEQKENATVCCQGGFRLTGSESSASKSDGPREALSKSKPSSGAPSEVEKQRPDSTSCGLGEAVVNGPSEPVCGQASFHAPDSRFPANTPSLRRFGPLTSRDRYIDALKAPAWPQLVEPAGTGCGFPGQEWSTCGIVGKCPSFGALPNYLHHQPVYQQDQIGVIQQPAFHSSAIFHRHARNAPAFASDQMQPGAGANAVECTSRVGSFGSFDACSAFASDQMQRGAGANTVEYTSRVGSFGSFDCSAGQGAGIYERAMWPGGYCMEEGHWASDRLVGKSQSMRALYCCHKEENEALRRALHSVRRAANHLTQSPGVGMDYQPTAAPVWAKNQLERELQEANANVNARLGERRLDRYVATDAAEGRTVSMRERGRWGEQDKAGGETPGGRQGFSSPIWGMEGAQAHSALKHMPGCWCREEGIAAFHGGHRLCLGGGARGEGRWQDDSERMRWGDEWQRREASGAASRLKTWQAIGGGGGAAGGGLTVREQLTREGIGAGVGMSAAAGGVDESRCAMCDGKLRRLRNSSATKKLGLPLRLCPACHPRPTASLPPSTTKASTPSPPPSPPPLRPSSASARGRNHAAASVATAISIACKPNIGATASSSASRKKSKSRIVDLCRHLVGLSMKPSAA